MAVISEGPGMKTIVKSNNSDNLFFWILFVAALLFTLISGIFVWMNPAPTTLSSGQGLTAQPGYFGSTANSKH